jgi:hypothetical protein
LWILGLLVLSVFLWEILREREVMATPQASGGLAWKWVLEKMVELPDFRPMFLKGESLLFPLFFFFICPRASLLCFTTHKNSKK